MTGKAIVFMGRRGCAFLASMLVVLVLGDRLEMLRWPSAGRDSTVSGHLDAKKTMYPGSFVSIVYADAQPGAWQDASDMSDRETNESQSESVAARHGRRGRSVSNRGRRQALPLYKRYAKELMAGVGAVIGLLLLAGGYKYFKGSPSDEEDPDSVPGSKRPTPNKGGHRD